ncbi:MAG: type II secretion system protein [Patescibacteria group bacterium]
MSGKQVMLKGFTLIELLVSVGIFSIVMVIALGALLAMSEADRKAQTLKTVVNNLNFSLESMSRTIRTGYDYHCGSPTSFDCTSGMNSLYFTGADGRNVIYRFANSAGSASLCGQSALAVGCILRSVGGSSEASLTAPEVVIENAKFYVLGSPRSPDTVQPRVTILVSGYVNFKEGQKSQFNIQTTVTQRVYDQ